MELKAKSKMSIHNRFDIEVIDGLTGKIKQKAYAENIVLDALWTRLLAPNTYFNYIFFGTGTGTLAASRTSLFTHLGYKAVSTPTYTYDLASGWISLRQQCQLAETENVGSTLSEVGIGYGTASTNLVTHALLKDMNGNTITIVKTAVDIINIYATVFAYWSAAGYDDGSIIIAGSSIDSGVYNGFITKFLLGIAIGVGATLRATNNTDGFKTCSLPIAAGYYQDKSVSIIYTTASRKISIATTRFAVAQGNIGGIRNICLLDNSGEPSINFNVKPSGWFEKSTILGEAIGTGDGVTTRFSTDFGFLKDGAKIYIDGVEQTTGVTVTTGVPLPEHAATMGRFFRPLTNLGSNPNYGCVLPFTTESAYAYSNIVTTFENPFYAYGIASFTKGTDCTVAVSDDQVNWTTITSPVAEAYRYKRYWKLTKTEGSGKYFNNFVAYALPSYNIEFTTPPASGAVITGDYDTETIAKDVNHVFDFSFEITLGEKSV